VLRQSILSILRVGLKLPRATTGMFEKMNDAVEEAMQTIVLKTIEDEYKRTNDVMAAETKGVEKLKELLGKIEEVGTMSEEFLKLAKFIDCPIGKGGTFLKGTTDIGLANIKDYIGLKIQDNNNFISLAQLIVNDDDTKMNGITPKIIITDNSSLNSSATSDFNKANNEFEGSAFPITIWIHYFENAHATSTTNGKLFYKIKANLTRNQEELVSEKIRFINKKEAPLAKGGGTCTCAEPFKFSSLSPFLCLSIAKQCSVPKIKTIDYQLYLQGIYDGFLDSFFHDLQFAGEVMIFVNHAMNLPGVNWVLSPHYALTQLMIDGSARMVQEYFPNSSYANFFKEINQKINPSKLESAQYFAKVSQLFANWFDKFNLYELFEDIGNVVALLIDGPTENGNTYDEGHTVGGVLYAAMTFFIPVEAVAAAVVRSAAKATYMMSKMGYKLMNFPKILSEGIGKFAESAIGVAKRSLCKAKLLKGYCFIVGTPILATSGLIPIEKIQVGSNVVANTKITKGYAATLAQNEKVVYLALDSEVNPDPYTSADQKALDKLDYSSIEMQKVTLLLKKSPSGDLGVANGTVSEIQLLRPTAWLETQGIAAVGKSTYLHLPEMGLDGFATVTDLAHFRVTKSDTASEDEWSSGLVTGVFKHIANSVYHLRYSNGDSLGVTGTHPLYSLDRQQFIPTEDIKVGEHLLSKSGIITVVSKTYDPTPQAVYNLEVGQWHNFLVGVSGVVVHNTGCFSVTPTRRTHILDGDVGVPGSGHGPNRGNTQGVFPSTWTDDQCIEAIERVSNSPTSTWKQATGPGSGVSAPTNIGGPHPNAASTTNGGGPVRFKIQNNDHGIKIEVIVEPNGGGIITGYVK
jgi:hypothetical protein